MYFRISRFAPILTVLAASAIISSARADQDIFGEPQYLGLPDYGIVPGDFDNDGDIDLFGVYPPTVDSFGQLTNPGHYTINFNIDGLGSFSSQTLIDSHGVYTVFAADLNGDNNLDIIDGNLGVMLGNGDGTFGPLIEYSNDSGHGSALRLAFGDMDNDGDTDIVVPNNGPVLLNNGDGTFYTNFVSSDVEAGSAVGVGDIDEDGILDIATVRVGYDIVTIQLGLGDGQGNPGQPYTIPIGGQYPIDMALTDMNGDDHLDVVTFNRDTDDVSVILGNGDGTFGAPVTYEPHAPAYYEVRQFKVADVSGDGAPDVVVTSTVYGDAESHTETGILLNDGDGGLTLDQTIGWFGKSYQNIAAADFDDNGNTDLATAQDLLLNQLPANIGMGVQPLDDFFSIGTYGGSFDPPSKTYTLTNNEEFPIEYSADVDADWLTIDNTGGMIPAGESVDVTVSINENAGALPNGDYDATVSLVNLTNHHGDRTRDVTLQVGIAHVVYSFPMDVDPGWQTEGDWAFGQPTGQGGAHGSPDPTGGYTGSNVYGYNLNGDYPGDLWFTNLTTGAIDCSNLSHITLRFRRWLGVRDQPDDAYIRLSTDGDFFLYIWISQDEVYDSDWQLVEYDLSPFADGESTVYIQWTMGPTYAGGACGWNIDDVEILGVTSSGGSTGLDVYPAADYAAQGPQGGPFDPPFMHYTVSNNTDHEVDYSVTKTADWITIDNATGTLSPGGAADVTIHINSNANDLLPGRYDDTLMIRNDTDGGVDATRAVSLGLPQVVYSFPLDTDPGWQTEGLWAFGQPTGQGGQHGNPDPTSGYTGANVYGYNLDGDYENNLPETNLTTTAIDCSDLSFVTLRFRRWLNLEEGPYDHAYVRVSNDGVNWTDLWANEDYVTLEEDAWQEEQYSISSVADGQSTVFIRWTMGATDNLWQYSGWNIDDVEILGVDLGGAPPPGDLPGDLDGDGDVDSDDFKLFAPSIGGPGVTDPPRGCKPSTFEAADLDGDGDVDVNDFCEFQTVFDNS